MRLTITLSFTLLVLTSFAQIPAYVPQNGLAGWWPFNGNANDLSGNDNHGAVSGATLATDRFNMSAAAYSFDGNDDHILIQDDMDDLDLTADFTISCWLLIGSLEEAGHHIVTKHYGNLDGMGTYVLVLGESAGQPGQYFPTFQATPNFSPAANPDGVYPFELFVWYHLVVTYDNATETLTYYMNGEVYDVVNVTFNIVDTNIDMLIGSTFMNNSSSMAYYFHGKLDDIGVWKRVLTAEEVEAMYLGISTSSVDGVKTHMGIHPNPTTDAFVLQLPSSGRAMVTIYNAMGQPVLQGATTSERSTWDISTLASGYYTVLVHSDGSVVTRQLLKE